MKKKLVVEGMSCKHCSGRVARTLEKTPGVSDVFVNLEGGEATFECSHEVDMNAVMETIRELGFTVSGN